MLERDNLLICREPSIPEFVLATADWWLTGVEDERWSVTASYVAENRRFLNLS